MNILEIRNLTAGYGRKKIWEDFSLTLQGGEIVVLLGRNGCGKTTLLRAVQGSLPIMQGSIFVNGTDLSGLNVRKRAALVTTMPQKIPDAEGLTGMEYLEMGFYPTKGPFARLTDTDRRRITEKAEPFGAAGLLCRDLSEMSMGERQMLSLLRAELQDTPVLLLDEPASALDFGHTAELFAMLKTLAAKGKCILAVLHDPTMALRYGTRLLCLDRGGCFADLPVAGTPPEVMESALRKLYPTLHLHTDPVFCWSEDRQDG